jgi:hypothetical protein
MTSRTTSPPILANKDPESPSVFAPAALVREARRQKKLIAVDVPPVCILDPDGDVVRQLRKSGTARPFPAWPCYHTELDTFELQRGLSRKRFSARLLLRHVSLFARARRLRSSCQDCLLVYLRRRRVGLAPG